MKFDKKKRMRYYIKWEHFELLSPVLYVYTTLENKKKIFQTFASSLWGITSIYKLTDRSSLNYEKLFSSLIVNTKLWYADVPRPKSATGENI